VCGAGQVCQAGECVCSDASTPNFCPNRGCVDLQRSSDACGGCDTSCTLGQTCQAGECKCPIGMPADFCEGIGCLDLQTDAANCGKCGKACAAGQVCTAGECGCPQGKLACDDTCLDGLTDRDNCGECKNECPDAQACVNGQCTCTGAGLTVCGEGCASLASDPSNCGECGHACGTGEVCSGGSCNCLSGVYCGKVCEPINDRNNCGACNIACSAPQSCTGVSCECSGFGLTKCLDECYDLSNDELHCGSCNNVCRSGETCSNGKCSCPYPQTFCESAAKCVTLSNDATNCGSCGKVCSPTELCSGSSCVCPASGQAYCASEKKCVDTRFNTKHCGGCDNACRPTEVCSSGTCDCSGYSEQFCATANACVDVWTNNKHCGACDRACPAQTHCTGGGCTCDTAGQTLCPNNKCFDLQNDPKNCGACGNDCGGGFICAAGKCACPEPTVGTAVRLFDNTLSEQNPAAAWDGTHVGVAYLLPTGPTNGGTLNARFALLNPDGTLFKDVPVTTYTDASKKTVGLKLGLAWTGSEYGLVYEDVDGTKSGDALHSTNLVRLTPAGAITANVVVVKPADFIVPQLPAIAWSVPYGGYLISGSSRVTSALYYRRIGAQGTVLETPNKMLEGGICGTSIAVAPDGRATIGCSYSNGGKVAFFEADGSRVRPLLDFPAGSWTQTDSESVWDGTALSTAVPALNGGVSWMRDGGPAAGFFLIAQGNFNRSSAIDLVMAGTTLVLGSVDNSLYNLNRFKLSSTLTVAPTKIHNQISVVPTATVAGKTDLVQTSSGKLMAIWPDSRWGTSTELYAVPIDLKACP